MAAAKISGGNLVSSCYVAFSTRRKTFETPTGFEGLLFV